MTPAEDYTANARSLLDEAQRELTQGDLLQASEKLWGAAAHAVKAAAQGRGWEHESHRLLFRVIARLADETADAELRNLFHVANSLHSNFYENWMTEDFVEQGLQQVRELVRRLEGLA